MSIINILGTEKPSPDAAIAFVYTKERPIIPFIGIRVRADGSHERVVGVNCPTQKKSVSQVVDSSDPLVYLRVWKMLGELKVITDELVQISIQDCIIASQNGSRLENFAKTSVYRERGIYKQSMFEDAQKNAFAFKPSKELIQQVVNGFRKYGVPIDEKDPSDLLIVNAAPAVSPFVLAPDDESRPVSKIMPAQTGHFYKLLPTPQVQTA